MAEPLTADKPRPLDAREVANLLGVAIATVKKLDPEQLPYFRVGNRGDRRYDRDDVARYIARRRAG